MDGALVAPGSTVRLVVSVSPSALGRPGFNATAAMAILSARVDALRHGAAIYSVGTAPQPPSADEAAGGSAASDHGDAPQPPSSPLVLREDIALHVAADAELCALRVSFDVPAVLPPPASIGSGWSVFLPGLTLGGEPIAGLPLRLAIAGTTAVAVRSPQGLSAQIDGNYVTPAVSADGTVCVRGSRCRASPHTHTLLFPAGGGGASP